MKDSRNDPGVGPLAALLGVRRTLMEGGQACFELAVRPEHINPHGVVHGGVVYTLVDYAMGDALTSTLKPDEQCATLEVKINYLAPATTGVIRAEATVVQRSRRIGVLESRVYADGDRLIALASGTFYIQTRVGRPGPS